MAGRSFFSNFKNKELVNSIGETMSTRSFDFLQRNFENMTLEDGSQSALPDQQLAESIADYKHSLEDCCGDEMYLMILFDNFMRFAKEHGINPKDYKTLIGSAKCCLRNRRFLCENMERILSNSDACFVLWPPLSMNNYERKTDHVRFSSQ